VTRKVDIVQSVRKISAEALERLCEDEQFSTEANNLIINCLESLPKASIDGKLGIAIHPFSSVLRLSKSFPKAFGKGFTNRLAKKNKMMDIKFPLFEKSFRALQKESIDAFEKEFDNRLALTIGKEKTTRLKRNKKQHQLAFFRWLFSLCTVASLPYMDDDSTKDTGLLFL
jgi:hypothetical protein